MMLMIPREVICFARSRLTEAFICAMTLSQPFPVFGTINSSAIAAYNDVSTEPQEKKMVAEGEIISLFVYLFPLKI